MPPKNVHEKEQLKSLRQWVQEALGNANIVAQVSLLLCGHFKCYMNHCYIQ